MASTEGRYPWKLGFVVGRGKGKRIMTKERHGELREEGAGLLLSPWTWVDELLEPEEKTTFSSDLLIFGRLLHWRLLAPSCLLNPMTTLSPSYYLNDCIFIYFYFLFYFFCLFAFSRAATAAYGGSQARGLIRAVAAAYARATAMWDPSCVCDLHHNTTVRSNAGSSTH